MKNQFIYLWLAFVLCLTTWSCVTLPMGDSLVSVRALMQDEQGIPYSDCLVSISYIDKREPFDSIKPEILEDGKLAVEFNVPGRWEDSLVLIKCEGSEEEFVSERIGRERPVPMDMGKIILSRNQ